MKTEPKATLCIPKGMTPKQRDELNNIDAKSLYMPVKTPYTFPAPLQITNLTVKDLKK